MNKHKYLDDSQRARSLALILSLLTAVLALLGGLLAREAHTTVSIFVFIAATLLGIAAACFAMHFVRYNLDQLGSRKKFIPLLHGYAAYCILFAVAIAVGNHGAFSTGITHALLDGSFAALLVLLAYCLSNKKGGLVAVLVGLLTAALPAFGLDVWSNIILALLAVIAIVEGFIYLKRQTGLAILALLTGLYTAPMCIIAALKPAQGKLHMVLHTLSLLVLVFAALVAVLYAISLLPKKARSVSTAEKPETTKEKEAALLTGTAAATAGSTRTSAEEGNTNRSKWVVKEYAALPYRELLDAPVHALYGVSEGDEELLIKAFGIKTVGDLATNKFFIWAKEIVEEANK